MKIVCIADTHGLHRKMPALPDGDVLVVAGDITRTGGLSEALQFREWLDEQPHLLKVVIAGNHDFCFERDKSAKEVFIPPGTHYLEDGSFTIKTANEKVKFWGSPWQPEFFDWAFNLPRGKALADKWAMIPDDTDVLITHGPPAGILDKTVRGENTGCEDLLRRVLEVKPKAHVFGHIHEAYGEAYAVYEGVGTQFVNASICNLGYHPVNAPVVIEV